MFYLFPVFFNPSVVKDVLFPYINFDLCMALYEVYRHLYVNEIPRNHIIIMQYELYEIKKVTI